jgi:hypothetical protein
LRWGPWEELGPSNVALGHGRRRGETKFRWLRWGKWPGKGVGRRGSSLVTDFWPELGRRGARRRGPTAPACAGRGIPYSGGVGVTPAIREGWWGRVGAREGGGSLGWGTAGRSLGAGRSYLYWRWRRAVGLCTNHRRPL